MVCAHALDEADHPVVLLVQLMAAVEHDDQKIRSRYGLGGPLYSYLFDLVFRLAKPRSVYEYDRNPAK